MKDLDKVIASLVTWLREEVKNVGCKGLVFGLSGGIDSAVMAGLSKLAFPETSLGIIMPCYSNISDEEDARLVAEELDLEISKVDLSKTYDNLLGATDIGMDNKLAISNIKPRLRMVTLYYYGQSLNYLVAGPTNRSEFITGYYTKHGDSGVDILPLVSFSKREIYDLAKVLKIPKKIIDKVPSAGLWENQTDEEEMGFSYEDLENYINGRPMDMAIKEKIDKMYKNSSHKRTYPKKFEYNNL